MRDKGVILRNLNARALKTAAFSALCRIPGLREFLNYYEDAICFEDVAEGGSVQTLVIDPVRDQGILFSEAEKRDVLRCTDAELDRLRVIFKMARLADVTMLGSSGVTVENRGGRVLHLDGARTRMHPNWVIARPLRRIEGDPEATYINLLGVRRGHRHFAHFFWDLLMPAMVWLRHWHDPAERVIFLVREDLSAIQRDAFRFIAGDWPGVAFQTLRAGEKMHCARSIFLAYQNQRHSVDNTLARQPMRDVASLFLRHYDVTAPPPGKGRRIYLSRESAVLRRTKNEAALVKMLSKHGFEPVDTGRIPFRQQAELFASADAIVAPHGAALASLMFCRKGTRILEFFPANYLDDCFCRLGRAMELEYHYLFGGKGDFPKLAYTMDADELESAVKAMLGE